MNFTDFMNMWCRLAAALRAKGSYILIEYSSHDNAVDVRCYFSGWKSGIDPDYYQTFYFNDEMVLVRSYVK